MPIRRLNLLDFMVKLLSHVKSTCSSFHSPAFWILQAAESGKREKREIKTHLTAQGSALISSGSRSPNNEFVY